MRFLITGAGGYIGSVLCQHLLSDSHEVVAVDRPAAAKNLLHVLGHPRFEWTNGDARDLNGDWAKKLPECDVVVPLAAVVGQAACRADEGNAFELNYDAVRRLVERLGDGQKIIYLNTNSGYGCGRAGRKKIYTEADPMDPSTAYGQSKMGGERAVLERGGSVSFRLGSGIGVSPAMRWDVLAHDLMRQAATRDAIELYEPDAVRSFVHVRDVARAVGHASRGGLSGAYNLNHSCHFTKRQIVEEGVRVLHDLGKTVSPRIIEANDSDPDKRDGVVSSRRLGETAFGFDYGLGDALREVACLLLSEIE